MALKKLDLEARRRARLRYQIRQKSGGRARLSVFRSGKHIYAQIIDDVAGRTLAAASSLEKPMREALKTGLALDRRLGVNPDKIDAASA
jgi:large subunit ribosomal protein L18